MKTNTEIYGQMFIKALLTLTCFFKNVMHLNFYENIDLAVSYDEKLEVFRKTMVYSFDLTIKNLINEGKKIDKDTINARNYFLLCKEVFKNV